jgi:hypothetical protein
LRAHPGTEIDLHISLNNFAIPSEDWELISLRGLDTRSISSS